MLGNSPLVLPVRRSVSLLVSLAVAGAALSGFPFVSRLSAEENLTVTVGKQSAEGVVPINAPFVKSQLQRVEDAQNQLDELRKQEQELPAKIKTLEAEIRKVAESEGAAQDAGLRGLKAEREDLARKIALAEKELKALDGQSFDRYQKFVVRDRKAAELAGLVAALEKNETAQTRRVRELASKNPDGAAMVENVWAAEVDLAVARRARGNVQLHRDVVMRSARGAINAFLPAGDGRSDQPEVIVPVAPPADAAERRERFAARNSPEALAALGKRFFGQMDLSLPGLEETAGLAGKGDFPGALDAYKRYFFRAAAATAAAEGVPAPEGEDEESGEEGGEALAPPPAAVRPPGPRAIAEAMEGAVSQVLPVGKKESARVIARLGEPGVMNWTFPDEAPKDTPELLKEAEIQLALSLASAGQVGSALLDSYVLTGNRDHLKRWAEITDDWSMNWPQDIDRSKTLIRPYNMLIGYQHSNLVTRLRNNARLHPGFVEDLPSSTLARMLLAANAEYLTAAVRLMRSGQYNFRIMMLTNLVPHALSLPEFSSLRWTAREATRLAELSMVHNIRRDGANATLANAGHENTDGSMLSLVDVMKKAKPDWLAPWWTEEFTLNLASYTGYWLHFLKQDGRAYRISTSPLDAHYAPGSTIKVSLLSDDPEVQKRMWKVFHQAFPYNDPAAQRRIWTSYLKGEPELEPEVRSESMAFSGYSFLRSGWDPGDFFLYFHGLSQPVASGRDDRNGFTLQAGGLNFLNAPPVYVDGRIQFIAEGLPPGSGGKAIYSYAAKPDAVTETRFHTSDTFDLAEGVYDGPYVYHPEFRRPAFGDIFGSYGYDGLARRLRGQAEKEGRVLDETPVRDVRHTRQVLSVQGRDVYIVTDFLESPQPRTYDQKYGIFTPVSNDRFEQRMQAIAADKFDAVSIDPKANMVKVRNPGFFGMDMFFFGNLPITYDVNEPFSDRVRLKKQPANAPVLFRRVLSVGLKADGPSSVTTVLAPYRKLFEAEPAPALTRIEPLSGRPELSGFRAEFADGTPVFYSASVKPARLTAGGLAAEARTLLRVGDRGIALDCRSIELDGKAITPAHPDFEFVIKDKTLSIAENIYRPIKPVTIEPEASVFVDPVEVKLASATPGVEIRYTVDGSEPRHDSPLYTGPFTIRDTTWVKARAFRKGLAATPWSEDGTHSTVTSWAVFEREDYLPAVDAPESVPGMKYEYFEDIWPVLMAEGPDLPAAKTGILPAVLDVSPREGTETFGIRYEGYLDVPKDGVYTFYAPPEFQLPDQESGYDLRVYVEGREWYPVSRWHGHGTWSVPLRKGKHPFKVFFADMRRIPHREEMMWGFPKKDFVWQGQAPKLEISGPDMPRQSIPASMLSTSRP